MYRRELFGVVLCVLVVWFSDASDFIIDDDANICDAGTTMGTCMPFPDCAAAVESVRLTRKHNFSRCGFNERIEIVCCPNQQETTQSPLTTTTSKAQIRGPQIGKSIEACEAYSSIYSLEVNYQILGGEDADVGEFPHMAVLGYQREDASALSWDCGGSLISDRYVVTAAHCISMRDGKLVKIRMGTNDISPNNTIPPVDVDIEKVSVHPKYSRRARSNDIALILLSAKVGFTKNVRPACLYQKSDDPPQLVIIGFGSTAYAGEVSAKLQKAFLNPVPVAKCNASHNSVPGGKNITVTQICATSDDGKRDTCQGDSGGPLQVQLRESSSAIYHIVGITSFGRACGGSYPGVYTRVFSYLGWIEGIVWPDETPA